MREAKAIHKLDWEKNPTPQADHEQSWRAFKGKNFEKLIKDIIEEQALMLGLKVINGNTLERSKKLNKELSLVKRNLAIDYGEFGLHLPDVDIVIYEPNSYKVLAVLSCKTTMRERIAQTGYWKLKLLQDEATQHIKMYLITLDEDKDFLDSHHPNKIRAIAEVDLDGSYILSQESFDETEKVKSFKYFIDDLKKLLSTN